MLAPGQDQQALLLQSQFGEFVLGTIPIPKPGRDEVLVEICAAALNPVDWKIQKTEYGYLAGSFPAVIGADIAGKVVELGEGVTQLSLGDDVFFQGLYLNEYAAFQKYTKADVHTLAKIPPKLSYDEASSFPVALTAAYVGLYNNAPHGLGFEPPLTEASRGKYSGTPIVILGGSSAVGQFVIQLAKASGFSPIIVTSSLRNEEYLKTVGASHVIDRYKPLSSLQAEVQKITTIPITTVYDATSVDETQKAGLDLLASGGRLVIVLKPIVSAEDKEVIMAYGTKRMPFNVELLRNLYAHIDELLEADILKPPRIEVIPGGLNGITAGLKKLEEYRVSATKLVVHPQETV